MPRKLGSVSGLGVLMEKTRKWVNFYYQILDYFKKVRGKDEHKNEFGY